MFYVKVNENNKDCKKLYLLMREEKLWLNLEKN